MGRILADKAAAGSLKQRHQQNNEKDKCDRKQLDAGLVGLHHCKHLLDLCYVLAGFEVQAKTFVIPLYFHALKC